MGKRFRKERHTVAYLLVHILTFASFIPRWIGTRVAGCIGILLYVTLGRERRRMYDNIALIYPDKKASAIRMQSVKTFYNLGISFFDALKLPSLPKEKFFSYIGDFDDSIFKEVEKQGRGAVFLSGHLSSFELQTQIAQLAGFKGFSIGAKLFDDRIDAIINKLRTRNGVRYIARDGALRGIIKALKENLFFGVLIDQDTTNDGVFAPFMGRPAFTPATSIKIALKQKSPILYYALARHKDGKYYPTIIRPNYELTGDVQKDLLAITKDFNEFYGAKILEHPEQWPWMHRRWKRSPADHPNVPSIDND